MEQGVYALPWDMTTSGHRQWSPFWVAQRTAQFVSEASATLKRRAAGTAEDVWLKSNLYPDYYLNTFHFQVIWVDLLANSAVSCTVSYFFSDLPGKHACTAHR